MRLSFRDPDGFVWRSGTDIYRCIYPSAAPGVLSFLTSSFASAQIQARALVSTKVVSGQMIANLSTDVPDGSLILEHEPIRFPNFPYEWCSGMLQAAAELTIGLAETALTDGLGLKDGTPYNVMFDGPRAMFIDLLSFERRDPGDPIWQPYGQFVRSFLYPLLANRYLGLQLDELLLTHRDGLEPERMRRMCPPTLLVRQPFRSLVLAPALASRFSQASSPAQYRSRRAKSAEEAKFLLRRLFRRARSILRRLPPARPSKASRYDCSGHDYSDAELSAKQAVVEKTLEVDRPRAVLDIGCNTGRFSLLAARCGSHVVAIDRDEHTVGVLWNSALDANADVLPLVVDIARPPGAVGWSNEECPSFLDRARGRFDCVLMLALMHHLTVNERAPLAAMFELLAGLTTRTSIVEYIDPADAQFQRILRGRAALHRDLTPASFEAAARTCFRISGCCEVTPTRRIYTLERAR